VEGKANLKAKNFQNRGYSSPHALKKERAENATSWAKTFESRTQKSCLPFGSEPGKTRRAALLPF
jgi:hypothetical protein